MIFEHEIPEGSNLYFGKSAKLKREFETEACMELEAHGFEEIVTPYFTFFEQAGAIKVNDPDNNTLSLRADSSLDVVRLITKRLGRSTKHKKWFYIQPIFCHPSTEINQIGAEFMDYDDEASMIALAAKILSNADGKFTLQLSSAPLVKIAASESGIDFDHFKTRNIAKLKASKIGWLDVLLAVETVEDAKKALDISPEKVSMELGKLILTAGSLEAFSVKIDTIYVSSANYYTGIFFRIFDGNDILVKGGAYKTSSKNSFGFAVYTDNVIKKLEMENQ
jgi:histidyl-tRNA synthetase